MNTNTRTVTAHTTAAHAEDAGVAAYRVARQSGATPEQAMRAHTDAYAAAIKS